MKNSSYWKYSAYCYDIITWASHCKLRDGAHWYNQVYETVFLGNLFILKADKSTSLSTAITPQCSVAESCAYADHSSYRTVTSELWLDYNHDFHYFPPTQERTWNIVICQLFSVEWHLSTKYDLWRSALLLHKIDGPSCLTIMHFSQLMPWLQNNNSNNDDDDDNEDDDKPSSPVSWASVKNRKVAKFFPIQITTLTQSLHITDVIPL